MSEVLAKVGGIEITDADVDAFIESLPQEQKHYASNPHFRNRCKEQLIDNHCLALCGEEQKLDETEEFQALMARVRKDLLSQMVVNAVMKEIAVTDEEAKAFYEQNQSRFQRGESVSAKHILVDDGVVTGVETEQHGIIDAFAVILATGGLSYPRTGSTGDGYRMAEEVGHTVTEIVPSLVPMTSDDPSCADMQGLSLRNVSVSVVDVKTGKTVYSDFGEMLFTHFGVSGPVILSASSHLHELQKGEYELRIDLKPALSDEQLEARLLRDFEANSNKDFRNSLGDLLPKSMIPVFLRKTGVNPYKKVNQITREERREILHTLREFTIPLSGFRPVEEAIVTSGGVQVKEVDPKTMGSKLVEGLYFAGEVLDVDAYTGGFNLQIAFSTGRLAGISV